MSLVLIIDDDPDMRRSIRDVLELLFTNLTVWEAENGQRGLEMVDQQRPDYIFMDFQMPIMNGYETAVALQAHPQRDKFILIGMTGSDSSSERVSVMKRLCDRWQHKPLTVDKITAVFQMHPPAP